MSSLELCPFRHVNHRISPQQNQVSACLLSSQDLITGKNPENDFY